MQIFKSRTVWMVIGMVIINTLQAIVPFLSPEKQAVVNGVLGVLAIYYRANPQAQLGWKPTDE